MDLLFAVYRSIWLPTNGIDPTIECVDEQITNDETTSTGALKWFLHELLFMCKLDFWKNYSVYVN